MRATIDGAGRLVVPKALRDELQLTAGTELEVRAVDGRLEVERPPLALDLVDHDGLLVAEPSGPAPATLTDDDVRRALERARR
jgi:AbrB family looped-hinge helix DNA binding protein